jgi:nucleotide-binding universal stress UspA family protein
MSSTLADSMTDNTPRVVTQERTNALCAAANPAREGGPVLLAIHGMEASHAPIIAARLLADRLGVKLRVVTVVDPASEYGVTMDLAPVLQTARLELSAAQKAAVEQALRDELAPGTWHLETLEGQAAREIGRMAAAIGASMIIVDAAPRTGIRHRVAGLHALQIARRATCPLLSVAEDFTALPRTIVCAVDFSPASIRAIQTALLLAAEGARFVLVHVPSPLHFPVPVRDHSGALMGDDVEAWFTRLRDELEQYAPQGLHIETRLAQGKVTTAVLDIADELRANLVVAGTHGRNIVERFFVGSATTGILHAAQCSVLTAPAPRPAEFTRLELRLTESVVEEDKDKWREILDALSKRDAGRRVTIEVDDPTIGAQVEATGYRFRGVVYDPHDRRVEIMVGDGTAERAHLTHTIGDPRSIAIQAHGGRDDALEIAHGRGHTLVLFDE